VKSARLANKGREVEGIPQGTSLDMAFNLALQSNYDCREEGSTFDRDLDEAFEQRKRQQLGMLKTPQLHTAAPRVLIRPFRSQGFN
jgi:hypothetical protein